MISLITTYYNEPQHLIPFLENECSNIFSEVIIVDDGSQIYPAKNIMKSFDDPRFKLYRIKEDLGFNSHGARNLAMKQCTSEWAMLVDIDRVGMGRFVNILERYVLSAKDKEYFNWFLQNEEEPTHNDYCIRVDDFWISGGYDEEFVNWHFGDRLFIDRLNSYMYPTSIPYELVASRGARKTSHGDVAITTYPDDKTLIAPKCDKSRKQEIIDQVGWRNDNKHLWIRDNILQFEWERVL
jgi:glycosyltransferase involved in cell wall biosynthesis